MLTQDGKNIIHGLCGDIGFGFAAGNPLAVTVEQRQAQIVERDFFGVRLGILRRVDFSAQREKPQTQTAHAQAEKKKSRNGSSVHNITENIICFRRKKIRHRSTRAVNITVFIPEALFCLPQNSWTPQQYPC